MPKRSQALWPPAIRRPPRAVRARSAGRRAPAAKADRPPTHEASRPPAILSSTWAPCRTRSGAILRRARSKAAVRSWSPALQKPIATVAVIYDMHEQLSEVKEGLLEVSGAGG